MDKKIQFSAYPGLDLKSRRAVRSAINVHVSKLCTGGDIWYWVVEHVCRAVAYCLNERPTMSNDELIQWLQALELRHFLQAEQNAASLA